MDYLRKIHPPMSQILADKFIELYGHYAALGYPREIIVYKTMYKLQEIVIHYMQERPGEIAVIAAAYDNIKHDATLHQKAIIAYELSTCKEEVKAKYMPLVRT